MNKFLSKFAYVAPTIIAIAMIAGMAGINTALADRVSTAAGTVSSVGVSSSGSITVGSSPVTTSGTITADINTANSNTWTALQKFFGNASSTIESTGRLYVGATATTTIDTAGNIVIPSGAGLTNTGRADGCATWATALLTSNGAPCGSVTSVGLSDSNSTLTIGSTPVTTTGTITATLNLGHANTWTALQQFNGQASSTQFSANRIDVGATATTTLSSDGKIGFASTTPTYNISGAAGTTVVILEKDLATSTSMTLNPSNGAVQLARIGTAAVTFTGAGFVPGAKISLTVCNPNASAGAITWSGFHTFGTAPSQTTTANQCDAYVVGMTQATSTTAANGVLYYAQAGAGLQ